MTQHRPGQPPWPLHRRCNGRPLTRSWRSTGFRERRTTALVAVAGVAAVPAVYDPTPGIEFPRWCVDGEMNIVHNLLDKWQTTPVRDQVALRWEGEEGVICTFTYGELDAEVCRCANTLRGLGLVKGDAIGLYMPMIPELTIAFLAIQSATQTGFARR